MDLDDVADDAVADQFASASDRRLELESVRGHQCDTSVLAGVDHLLCALDGRFKGFLTDDVLSKTLLDVLQEPIALLVGDTEVRCVRVYRNTARVPRGRTEIFDFRDDERRSLSNHLTPRVNRVSYMIHSTVLTSTVATWVKDLNPQQLRAVARNAPPLKTRVLDVVRRVLSDRGGATGPHGHNGCSGGNSSRPISGRSRGIKFACDSTPRFGTCGQNGEASGSFERACSLVMTRIYDSRTTCPRGTSLPTIRLRIQ